MINQRKGNVYLRHEQQSNESFKRRYSTDDVLSSPNIVDSQQPFCESVASSTSLAESEIERGTKCVNCSDSHRTSTSEFSSDSYTISEIESSTDQDSTVNLDDMPRHIRKLIHLGLWGGNYKRSQEIQELYDMGILKSSSESEETSSVYELSDLSSFDNTSASTDLDNDPNIHSKEASCSEEEVSSFKETPHKSPQPSVDWEDDLNQISETESKNLHLFDCEQPSKEYEEDVSECFSEFDIKEDSTHELKISSLSNDTSLQHAVVQSHTKCELSIRKDFNSVGCHKYLWHRNKRRKTRKELNELYIRACCCPECSIHRSSQCTNNKTNIEGNMDTVGRKLCRLYDEHADGTRTQEGINLPKNTLKDAAYINQAPDMHSLQCKTANKFCRKFFDSRSLCKETNSESSEEASKHYNHSIVEQRMRKQRLRKLLRSRRTTTLKQVTPIHSSGEETFDRKCDSKLESVIKKRTFDQRTPLYQTEFDSFDPNKTAVGNKDDVPKNFSNKKHQGWICNKKGIFTVTRIPLRSSNRLWQSFRITIKVSQLESGVQKQTMWQECNKLLSDITRRRFASLTIDPRGEINRTFPSVQKKLPTSTALYGRKQINPYLPKLKLPNLIRTSIN